MLFSSNMPQEDESLSIRIQLNIGTLLSIAVLLALSFLGGVYVIKLCTKPRCNCPLCDGEYEVVKRLGYVLFIFFTHPADLGSTFVGFQHSERADLGLYSK
eukprot:gb/GECG01013941.1/.p1 GENE.gb/GECG01013941.1/~~gb/GECG01013941.1/.p1  ORF type:complete len:101 (+),score=5.41 gb/GECG01013941.1/:1-303(+)